jgi:F-type H+-transporting ATPase subunit delta
MAKRSKDSKIEKLISLLEKINKQKQGEAKALKLIEDWQKENEALIAYVLSAVPLNNFEVKELQTNLGSLMDKPVVVINRIDKNVLGGLKITINSQIIDASLAGQLKKFQDKN